jgi:Phage tail assembly chaperone proteins, E, or 41 or 14
MTTETETIAPEWPFKIKLRKPIVSADGELQELSLREPTAGDLAQAGVPVVIDFSGDARAERRSSQEE